MITKDYLHECLEFDFEKGVAKWKERPLSHFKSKKSHRLWNVNYSGNDAGSIDNKGYRRTKINGVSYKFHRLIWLALNGIMPYEQVDHINGIKSDNRISNLRLASQEENQRNTGVRKDNSTGVRGVSNAKGKFIARSQVNKKRHCLGSFDTLKDAELAVSLFNKIHHMEFYHA